MKETTNLKLKKPDLNDFYNVEDFNYNSDVIDRSIKEVKDTAESKAPKNHTHNASDIDGISTNAKGTSFDNSTNGMVATNVQDAIEENKATIEENKASIEENKKSIEANKSSILELQNELGTNKTTLQNNINAIREVL